MGVGGRLGVVAGLALVGCSAESGRFLTPPNVDGYAALIAIIHDRDPPRGFAIDLGADDWRLRVELEIENRAEIDLIAYECSLESLDLEPGPVIFASDGRRPLIAPVMSWSIVGGIDALAWTPLTETPARVTALRMEGPAPTMCSDVAVEELVIDGELNDPRMLALDEGGLVVIGMTDGTMYHLDVAAREITRAYVGARASGGRWISAARDRMATLFFSTGRGCLGIGEGDHIRELGCIPTALTATAGQWTYIDSNNTSRTDISAAILLDEGEMFRFSGGSFEKIELQSLTDVGDKGGVHYASENEIYFAGPRQQELIKYNGRSVTTELMPLNMFDKVTSVLRGAGRGDSPVVLSNGGRTYVRDGSVGWALFANTGLPQARRIAAFKDRFFVGGESQIVEVLADGTVCPSQVNIADDVRRMLPLENEIVIVADPPDTLARFARVIILTPRLPEQLCQ